MGIPLDLEIAGGLASPAREYFFHQVFIWSMAAQLGMVGLFSSWRCREHGIEFPYPQVTCT